MGSLPDLTERARTEIRPAARTLSDPNKNRIKIRPSVAAVEWSKKGKKNGQKGGGTFFPSKRKDSCSSSVGAASVRRLLNRAPPRPPSSAFSSFAMLCATQFLGSAAITSLTVVLGTENSTFLLALMHLIGAFVTPFSCTILNRISIWKIVSMTQGLLTILFLGITLRISNVFLIPFFIMAGVGVGPLGVTIATAATTAANSLAVGAMDEEVRRRVLLRRLLRALRAAQDLGLLLGALILGIAVNNWPVNKNDNLWNNTASFLNSTKLVHQWPPPQFVMSDDTSEEDICGANGCPGNHIVPGIALNPQGQYLLFIVWVTLILTSLLISVLGTRGLPKAHNSDNLPALPFHKEPRSFLAAPMGFFIGLQTGFIFTSYVKWYAVCVGGWEAAWTSLAGVATLQALAAATLSMAAARGMRGALGAGGAAAHGCLVLALVRWRAASSDVALPAVAAAAWGACGGLWDVLQTSSGVGAAGWRPSWSVICSARQIGMALACAACGLLCVRMQLAVLVASLILAAPLHFFLEFRLRKANEPRIAETYTPDRN